MSLGGLEALGGVFGMVLLGLIALGQLRKTQQQENDRTKKDFQEVIDLQAKRLESLQALYNDLHKQQVLDREDLTHVRRDNEIWIRRNSYLFRLVEKYRARLAFYGEETPEPNGEEL